MLNDHFKKRSISGHQAWCWYTWCSHHLSLYAQAPRDEGFITRHVTVEGVLSHVCYSSVVSLLPFCRLVCTSEKVFVFWFFFNLYWSYAKVKIQLKPEPLLSSAGQACKLTAVPQWVPHMLFSTRFQTPAIPCFWSTVILEQNPSSYRVTVI